MFLGVLFMFLFQVQKYISLKWESPSHQYLKRISNTYRERFSIALYCRMSKGKDLGMSQAEERVVREQVRRMFKAANPRSRKAELNRLGMYVDKIRPENISNLQIQILLEFEKAAFRMDVTPKTIFEAALPLNAVLK